MLALVFRQEAEVIKIIFALEGRRPTDRSDARLLELKRAFFQHGHLVQAKPGQEYYLNEEMVFPIYLNDALKPEDEVWLRLKFDVRSISYEPH